MLCEGANVNNKGLSLEPCGTFPRPGAGTGQAGEEGWRCARQPRWQPRPLLTRPERGMWVGGGAGHPNQTHPGHPHTNRPSIRPKTPNHPLSSYSSLPLNCIESNSSSLASLCEGWNCKLLGKLIRAMMGLQTMSTALAHLFQMASLQCEVRKLNYRLWIPPSVSVETKACVQWSDFSSGNSLTVSIYGIVIVHQFVSRDQV